MKIRVKKSVLIRALGTLLLLPVLLFGAVDINLFGLFGMSPGFDDIRQPQVCEASLVYSCDSVLIGRFYDENRTPAKYEDLTDTLINTLIDTEDERFYKHRGVDIVGMFSALRDILTGSPRGASTISQQLAKNLFRTRTHYSTGRLGRIPGIGLAIIKIKEMIVAMKLEHTFSKQEILTMYLNTVDFGSHAFGINTAARTYFDRTPRELTVEQCATLVGLLKATNTYNPRRNPQNSLARRNLVLGNLYTHGHLVVNGQAATKEQLDSICSTPLLPADDQTRHEDTADAIAPYFRQALADHIATLCRMGLVEGCDSNNILDINTAGLTIITTLDTRMQAMAEEAVAEQMAIIQQRFDDHWRGMNPWRDERHQEIPDFIEDIARRTPLYRQLVLGNTPQATIDSILAAPHAVSMFAHGRGRDTMIISTLDSIRRAVRFMHTGFVAIEPGSRHIKAWVGDIDYSTWQYDKVLANRQPGSTFKLFVYAEAMNQGLTPVDTRLDAFHAYADTVDGKPTHWMPHNANGYFSNMMLPLKCAFAQSINSVAVALGYEVGAANIVKTAHAMGIESELRAVPSIALGSNDVNLLELTNSYATAVDDGHYAMPLMVQAIVDRRGDTIYRAPRATDDNPTRRRALPYKSAFYMQQMLRGGMTEPGGTTAALWGYIYPVCQLADFGGKTGTSNNHADAWFVGVTPGLVGGAWVGGEYRSIHFRTGELGQGSRTALPIFGRFMQKVLSDEHFAHYRQHFAKQPAEAIPENTYRGPSVYAAPPDDDDFLPGIDSDE